MVARRKKKKTKQNQDNLCVFVQFWIMHREIYSRFLDISLALISLHTSLNQEELLTCEKLI